MRATWSTILGLLTAVVLTLGAVHPHGEAPPVHVIPAAWSADTPEEIHALPGVAFGAVLVTDADIAWGWRPFISSHRITTATDG